MVRVKGKKTNGKLEGVSHAFTLRDRRKKPVKKRSPFSQEPSLLSLNVEKPCVRCKAGIIANELCWYYPKLKGYVHQGCSRKKVS